MKITPKLSGGLKLCASSPPETQGGICVLVAYRVIDCLRTCCFHVRGILHRECEVQRDHTFFKVKGDCHLEQG